MKISQLKTFLFLVSLLGSFFLQAQSNLWTNPNVYRFTSSINSTFDVSLGSTAFTGIYTNRSYFLLNREVRLSNGLLGSSSGNLTLRTGSTNRMTILSQTGNTGIRTTTPNFDFQLHGIYNYIKQPGGVASSSLYGEDSTVSNDANTSMSNKNFSVPINYGVASRIGLTNTETGLSATDGALIMMAQKKLFIQNQELDGDIQFITPGAYMTLSGSTQRIWAGGMPSTDPNFGYLNVVHQQQNGLYVQTNNTTKYGLAVKVASDQADAILCMGVNASQVNFKVKGNGEVYARKYITTLNNFPDYVFEKDYTLMPLSELRTFINTNGHLPNMPKATEVAEEGVDLGELNRLLTEKVEELTLYVLELEKKLSETNPDDIHQRLSELETLIKEVKENTK